MKRLGLLLLVFLLGCYASTSTSDEEAGSSNQINVNFNDAKNDVIVTPRKVYASYDMTIYSQLAVIDTVAGWNAYFPVDILQFEDFEILPKNKKCNAIYVEEVDSFDDDKFVGYWTFDGCYHKIQILKLHDVNIWSTNVHVHEFGHALFLPHDDENSSHPDWMTSVMRPWMGAPGEQPLEIKPWHISAILTKDFNWNPSKSYCVMK